MNCINHPDRPRVAFCQNCGKPLCAECARVVGSAVFDEPCLLERLNAGNAASGSAGGPGAFGAGPTAASTQYEPIPGGGTRYTVNGTAEGIPYRKQGTIPPPGAPNPGLALLLGFIPGVGAMYNGQYAKGVVHLIVFAILVSLADQHGIFGLFVTGWIAYQVIEAYQTAKARRDGTPLPNPFGLNDLGERLGFGKAWAAGPVNESAVPPTSSVPPVAPYTTTPFGTEAPGNTAAETQGPPYAAPYNAAESSAGSNPYGSGPTPYTASWGAPTESYTYPPSSVSLGQSSRLSRFPLGAVILIGLGIVFMIGNAGWLEGFPIHRLLPFLLIGLGIWIFVRRMLDTGASLADDGTHAYRLRVYRALRGSIWIILVGVLFLLDSFHILSWGRSWPLFIIVGGVIAILERTAYATPAPTLYPFPPASAPPTAAEPITPSAATTPKREAGEV